MLKSCFYLLYFTTYDSARGITSMIQKRLDKTREMILDRVTLKQGKTHCGRGLTDSIAHIVTDADGDLEQNKPSGAESIEMHVSPTSKYGSRLLLATYTSLLGKNIRS